MSINETGIECEKCGSYNCKYYCERCYNNLKKKYQQKIRKLHEEHKYEMREVTE